MQFIDAAGLATYYYGHLEPNRSIELNRCYYNTMVDNPYHFNSRMNQTTCRTMEPNMTCQDCRETSFGEIYTTHFTECGKMEWCHLKHDAPLCTRLFIEWHRIRTTLENTWATRYQHYNLGFSIESGSDEGAQISREFAGHCMRKNTSSGMVLYVPMIFPVVTEKERLI